MLNLLRRPILWPGVFGVHDLFHLLVMAGGLAHFWFILKVVVPFGRGQGEVFCLPGTLCDNAAFTTSSPSPGCV